MKRLASVEHDAYLKQSTHPPMERAPMSYQEAVKKAASLICEVAARGYLSAEIEEPHRGKRQVVQFYDSERSELRSFMGLYGRVLARIGKHPIPSFSPFGEQPQFTCPLLTRMEIMLRDSGPEYAMCIGAELEDSAHIHAALYETVDLERMAAH